jgi:cell division protein FtsA
MIGKKNEYGKLGVGKSKSLGVARGVVNNIKPYNIQQAIQEAENNSGYKIKDVVVGIAEHIRSIQHTDYISKTIQKRLLAGMTYNF